MSLPKLPDLGTHLRRTLRLERKLNQELRIAAIRAGIPANEWIVEAIREKLAK